MKNKKINIIINKVVVIINIIIIIQIMITNESNAISINNKNREKKIFDNTNNNNSTIIVDENKNKKNENDNDNYKNDDKSEQNEINNQQNQYGISDFLNKSESYIDEYSSEFNLSNIFQDGLVGKFDNNKLMQLLISTFLKNIKQSLFTMSGIIIVVVINSVLKAISENLGNNSVSKIAFYVQYILIVTLIMKNFSDIINSVKTSIEDLSSFSFILIPLLSTLIVATGNISTSSLLEPILLALVSFISTFVTSIILPIILIGTALGIISKISNYAQIDKLSKFFHKSTIWIITTVLGIFVGIASLESGLSTNIDGITKKAGKSIFTATIPVVGGIIGDAIDTIVGYTNIIKNATGIVGIFVIISICIKPIINLASLTIVYSLSSALCEPIADKKVVEIIEQMGTTFKTMLAIMLTIAIMLIIGLALVIKITS